VKVKLAKSAGFCWGVRRTMNIAMDAAENTDGPVNTFGPLIHNPQVVDLLASKGMKVVNTFDELQEGTTLVIRAHGIPPETRQELKSRGVKFRDGTCPLVAKVHAHIKKYLGQGYELVILGHKDHPEVIGHLGYAQDHGTVISSAEDVDSLPPMGKVCLVSQTTANEIKFHEVAERLKARYDDCVVVNTICDDTHTRQEEVLQVAETVDAMVIVGGKGSSNTQRLVELSGSKGIPAFHVDHSASGRAPRAGANAPSHGMEAAAAHPQVFDPDQSVYCSGGGRADVSQHGTLGARIYAGVPGHRSAICVRRAYVKSFSRGESRQAQ
jgi:(E)-4-hydroxy-3-methyl-but-2-enyl pyrophosphate reductase